MNAEFPESPEDRLLDELLHEQSHPTDAEFLQRIESAVDAGASKAAPRERRTLVRAAVAAAVVLTAGTGAWYATRDRSQVAPALSEASAKHSYSVVTGPNTIPDPERTEIVAGGLDKRALVAGSSHAEALPARTKALILPAPSDEPSVRDPFAGFSLGSSSLERDSLASSGGLGGGGTGGGRGDGIGRGFGSGMGPGASAPPASISGMDASFDAAGSFRDEPARDRRAPAPEGSNTERYGAFIDQPWKSSSRDPLSTFSIDVDTASYGIVRRMIQEGRAVPRDAVRIEECINAFSYRYEQPKGDGPFAVGADLAVCPWETKHQLVRVAIKGREIEAAKRPASNLVFLIDVSGSMQSPDKLPLLKQSMATLVKELDERDRVAIVVYAGNEGVALPSTRLDEAGRRKVLETLGKLEAGGSTNGGAGIKRAYELAMAAKVEGGVNRVILATDGDFNVGVTGQGKLVEMVKERAKAGVYLTVLGFGTGNLNDAMMDAVTRDGNGNYFYVDSGREAKKVFSRNLTGTLVTIAKDVKIQIEFNPAKVGRYRLIGYANRVLRNEDFANDKVDAGDIGAGHTVTAFYELMPPGEASGTEGLKYQPEAVKPAAAAEWMTVKLRYKHPEGDESRLIEFALTGDATALDKMSPDYQFATAVALFGMKLRNMEEVREVTWSRVLELAKAGLADDVSEDRAEFVGLLKKLAGESRRDVRPGEAEVVPGGR